MVEMEVLRAKVKESGGYFRKWRNSDHHCTVIFISAHGIKKKYTGHIAIIDRLLFSNTQESFAWRLREELL